MPRVLIGGPPHSGKSSFMLLMKNNLRHKKVKAGLFDLDYASPTLDWIEGRESKEERDKKKQPWTKELAEKAKADFEEYSKKFDVVLGDAPGKISEVTHIVTPGAESAIILSNDPKETGKWKAFYKHHKVPVICTLNSRLFGKQIFDASKGRGKVVNLRREEVKNTDPRIMGVEGCAFKIAEKFNLKFRGSGVPKDKLVCGLKSTDNNPACRVVKDELQH